MNGWEGGTERDGGLVERVAAGFTIYCNADCCAFIGVIILCISCLFKTVLSDLATDLINEPKSHTTCMYYHQSATQSGRVSLILSPCCQFALSFGAADNNHIMACIFEIWDFGCGKELDCCLSLFWHLMFLWLILTCLSKPAAFISRVVFSHEGGGSTFLKNASHHLQKDTVN